MTSDGSGNRVAAGAEAIYYMGQSLSNNGSLFRVGKSGGTPEELNGNTSVGGELVVDETHLYYTNYAEGLSRMDLETHAIEPLVARGSIRNLTDGGDQLFWIGGDSVERMDKVEFDVVSVLDGEYLGGIAVDDSFVYVTSGYGTTVPPNQTFHSIASGMLRRVSRWGGPSTLLASSEDGNQHPFTAVAVSDDYVYYISGSPDDADDQLWAVAKGGGSPVLIHEGQWGTIYLNPLPVLAADSLGVYWVGEASGRAVEHIAEGTWEYHVLGSSSSTQFSSPVIALDADGFYWRIVRDIYVLPR